MCGDDLTERYPRLCLVGPMIGRNQGHVTTQGEILSDQFSRSGYSVISTSAKLNRYRRLLDIVYTLIRYRGHYDIAVIQTYGGPSFVVEDIASWLARRLGKPVILHLRGGAMPEFMARFPRWTRRVLKRARLIVVPSQFLARSVGEHGFPSTVIPNVIDLSKYEHRARRLLSPKLFWMRSFHPIYNPQMAIRVLAKLRSTVPEAREATLVMAGEDKGFEVESRRLARELGLNGAVRFAGFLSMSGKAREGKAADIFINTNRIDNTPVAAIEACAMGLAVISTAVGGVPDLLTNGETALLIPDRDEQAAVDAVRRLLQDPQLAERLSVNGRLLAHQSSWSQISPLWRRAFTEVTSKP